MSCIDGNVLDLLTYQQQKLRQRKNHWRNFFDRYSMHHEEDSEGDDDGNMPVDDIVEVYGRSKRPRKYAEASNAAIYNTRRKQNETVVCNAQKVTCSNTETDVKKAYNENNAEKTGATRKRGRPPTKNNSKIKIEIVTDSDINEIDNKPVNGKKGRPKLRQKENTEINAGEGYNEPLIKLEGNAEITETTRKRGRPPTKNSSKINMEEVKDSDINDIDNKPVNRKKGRPKLHHKVNTEIDAGKEYNEPLIKLEITETTCKRGRPPTKNRSKINIEEVKDSDINDIDNKLGNGRKGRPKLHRKVNPEIDEGEGYNEPLIKLNDNVEKTETTRKRGKPSTRNNSKIKIEELIVEDIHETCNETVNKKGGRSRLKTNIKLENIDEPEYKTLAEKEMKNTSAGPQDVVVRKRSRPNLKSSVTGYNNTSRRPVKDFPEKQNKSTKKEINATSCEMKPNVKNKSTSPRYEKHIVHSFSKRELEKQYPDLIQNEKRFSRSFTGIPKLNENSRRSKSCINYSEKSLTLMHLSSAKNLKGKSREKEKSSTTLSQRKPRKTTCRNKYSEKTLMPNQPLHKADEKENAVCNTSQFNTALLDSDMLRTKYVVEEMLGSNLGLLMIKRYCNLQSANEGKNNNYHLWHNAVRSELIKLHKVVPMEKLEQYIEWYVAAWFSQAANAENCSKMKNVPKESVTAI